MGKGGDGTIKTKVTLYKCTSFEGATVEDR